MLKGISVTLNTVTKTGVDPFGAPVYSPTAVTVENVLVAPLSDEDVSEALNLTGKRAVYELAIPKGDCHDWEDREVEFFGEKFRVIGKPTQGIDTLIPLTWNKKVKVERYE